MQGILVPAINHFFRKSASKKHNTPKNPHLSGFPFLYSKYNKKIRSTKWEEIHFSKTITGPQGTFLLISFQQKYKASVFPLRSTNSGQDTT